MYDKLTRCIYIECGYKKGKTCRNVAEYIGNFFHWIHTSDFIDSVGMFILAVLLLKMLGHVVNGKFFVEIGKKVRRKLLFHIAVCDDQKVICEEIRSFARRYAEERSCTVDCSVFFSGEALYESLSKGNRFDVIFLDIELYRISGIEIGRFIRQQLKDVLSQIVYISARQEYAMELFESHPLNFLVKPLIYEKIETCLDRSVEIKTKRGASFTYNRQGEFYRIPLSNILYFESQNRKICVTRVCGKEEYYGKLNDVENQVKEHGFLRIHKSYIINMEYIDICGKTNVTMLNGDVLPISREKQKDIAEKILADALGEKK